MSKRRTTIYSLTRLEARTRVIKGAGKIAMMAFCVSLGFVMVATAFPQKRELDRLQQKLVEARAKEAQILFERDCRKTELQALREDPAYLELHARDRLGYCRPGERVLRFKQGE